jgi:hypothetical protein
MGLDPNASCERLKEAFEGREALYIEHGALRVRVSRITPDLRRRVVEALVEEIPTTGLEVTPLHAFFEDRVSPLRWNIGAGSLSLFSEHTWAVGYGGWSICCDPQMVAGVVALAARFTADLTPTDRYGKILEYVEEHPVDEQPTRVFPS